jgi:hypothetical protein
MPDCAKCQSARNAEGRANGGERLARYPDGVRAPSVLRSG